MDKHDWIWVLTKGFRSSKSNMKKKSTMVAIKSELNQDETNVTTKLEPSDSATDVTVKLEADEFATDGNENCTTKDIEDSVKNNISKLKGVSKEKQLQLKIEEINHFRNVQNIHVKGTDILPPIKSFEELKSDYLVNPKIVNNLLNEKYIEPTPIQMQAWPLLLKRREMVACAPTGSGKTASFLLPVIQHLKQPQRKGFRAIIMAPTRELAKQIVRESDRMTEGTGLKTNIINKNKKSDNSSYFKKFDILVTTPNRLIYLLQADEEIQKITENVEWLIVDESDKLFEDGKNGFREQLATIFRACAGPKVVRAMFSATLSFEVEEWCKLNLNDVVTVAIGTRNTCPDVDQSLSFCLTSDGKWWTLERMIRNGFEIPLLIFVQTKERAKELCKELLHMKRPGQIILPVQCIHSDMSQTKRDEIVRQFRERKIWILICTELMSRGIDFKGVNMVINYDFPPSIVSYVHRIGRTGRAGKKGKAVTFWGMEDRPLLRSVALVMKNSGSEVPKWILEENKSSQNDRKKYSKNMPDRGKILEGMKEVKIVPKKRKQKEEEEENSDDEEIEKPKIKKLKKGSENKSKKMEAKNINGIKKSKKHKNGADNKSKKMKNQNKGKTNLDKRKKN